MFYRMAEQYDQLSKRELLKMILKGSNFLDDNPDYLKNEMREWQQVQNPGKELTYDIQLMCLSKRQGRRGNLNSYLFIFIGVWG